VSSFVISSTPDYRFSSRGLSLGSINNKHRGALRGTPGSVCPQPEPNATEMPSCAPISARAAQRRRRRRWWRGEEDARRPGPEGQVLRHILWHVTSSPPATPCAASFTCSPFMCHLRAGIEGGSRPGRRAPQHTFFCPLKGYVCRVLYMLALHVSTATATWPAAPTKGFERSKSARR